MKILDSLDGKNLQHEAVKAATEGESILVIFPTAGGKISDISTASINSWTC